MKKIPRILILVLLMLFAATAASASAPQAAIVIRAGDETVPWYLTTCWVPDANGYDNGFTVLWEIPNCCTSVVTNSNTGVKVASCQGQLPVEAEFPDRLMLINYKNSGFECWWDAPDSITTTKYQFTITPTGRVNFYCVFKD